VLFLKCYLVQVRPTNRCRHHLVIIFIVLLKFGSCLCFILFQLVVSLCDKILRTDSHQMGQRCNVLEETTYNRFEELGVVLELL